MHTIQDSTLTLSKWSSSNAPTGERNIQFSDRMSILAKMLSLKDNKDCLWSEVLWSVSVICMWTIFLIKTPSDKDQDGTFRWVDKTAVEFSNWSPNFPQNTANQWDCGQIYTGKNHGCQEDTQCHNVCFKRFSWKSELNQFFFLVIGNYAGKWESTNCFKNLGYICKMSGGQNVKPTSAPGERPTHSIIWTNSC